MDYSKLTDEEILKLGKEKGLVSGKKYQIIYADPPWSYNDKMKMEGIHGLIRGAESFYQTMDIEDIKKLPINQISDDNCALYLWCVPPLHQQAMDVIVSWGFRYINYGFCWIKTTKNDKLHCGMGHYTRGNVELCLFAVKGRMANKVINHAIRQPIEAEIMRHSKKPEEIKKRIVDLFGDLSRIELFAREKSEGWDSIGNEINGKDIREELKEIINKGIK